MSYFSSISLFFKVLFFLLPLFFFSSSPLLAASIAENPKNISSEISEENIHKFSEPLQVFVRKNCAHCQAEEKFLAEKISAGSLKSSQVRYIDVKENFELFTKFSQQYETFGTPITLAGNKIFQGYDNDTTGEKILETYFSSKKQFSIESALTKKNSKEIFIAGTESVCTDDSQTCTVSEKIIPVPFIGEVSVTSASTSERYWYSFILGFLDGFNPCAMWVLTVFLIALIQVGDKLKMIFVAGTFMLAEVVMYGLILVLWWKFFNIFSISYEFWVNLAVGIVALGSGIFFLYEGITSDGTCKVSSLEQQRSISQKINKITNSPLTWISFFGILAIAFSVNVIEFACSAGYPQIFSKFLLPSFGGDLVNQIGILLTYLGAYMLDDIIVFGIALYSIEKIGITQKYSKVCNIIGGGLMLILGVIMLFAPQLLKGIFG